MSLEDLHYLPLLEVSERIRRRELSPDAVLEAILDRIARLDARARSYTTVLADRARVAAARTEAEIAGGFWRGPLHGIPLAVKDLCETSFAPTSGGMPMQRNWTPNRDVTVVRRLEDASAVIVGKLKMTEGAYTSHHPDDPAPLNPWNAAHWVGSSSTGSGVATALGLCLGSLGSDTGGVNPVSIGHLRAHRDQADLGPGQPAWHPAAGGIARSHWAHDAQCGRRCGHPGRDRRCGSERSNRGPRPGSRLLGNAGPGCPRSLHWD